MKEQTKATTPTPAAQEVPAPVGIGKLGIRAPLRWTAGDPRHEAELTRIVKGRSASLQRTLRRIGVQVRHLDDVASAVHMRLHRWMQKNTLPQREAQLVSLLHRMAVRETLTYIRNGRTEAPAVSYEDADADGLPEICHGPEHTVIDAQHKSLVETALGQMKQEDARLIRRVDFDDEPYADVADSLGRNPKTVYSQLVRARTELRERVLALCKDDDMGEER